MGALKLKAPSLNVTFSPSKKQYELWKYLQPECHVCGGEIKIVEDKEGIPKPVCSKCGNDNPAEVVLGGGAAGGGKSYLGSCWLISSCIKFPEIRAVVARKTLKSLKESTIVTIQKIMRSWGLIEGVNYKYNQVAGVITFWNNSKIILKEMVTAPSDPNFERFGSSEYTIAFVDEVSEIDEKAVEVLFSRLRWKVAETFVVSKMMLSTNPTTNWVRSRFVQDDNGKKIDELKKGDYYCPFRVDDNPDEKFVSHYKRSLMGIRDNLTRERLLYGNWDFVDVSDAAFYKNFDGMVHLKQNLMVKIDSTKPLIFSADFNVHPYISCLVGQVNYEKKEVYILSELAGMPSKKQNNTPALGKIIKSYYLSSENIGGILITGDPSGKSRSTQTEDGVNNFTIMQQQLLPLMPSMKILKKQPPQKIRGEWINSILKGNTDGWKILIDISCRKLTQDLTYQLENGDGTKEKKKVMDHKLGIKCEKYGHMSDCFDYLLCTFLDKSYKKYSMKSNGTGKIYTVPKKQSNYYV